jgi:hypothetical protein
MNDGGRSPSFVLPVSEAIRCSEAAREAFGRTTTEVGVREHEIVVAVAAGRLRVAGPALARPRTRELDQVARTVAGAVEP